MAARQGTILVIDDEEIMREILETLLTRSGRRRLISAGAAAQNVLLMATALGYGSALTAGQSVRSAALPQRAKS